MKKKKENWGLHKKQNLINKKQTEKQTKNTSAQENEKTSNRLGKYF